MDAEESKIFTAIIIAGVIIGIIISYFIITMIRQHKKVLRLQREKATAEITALEKDRARIAADLHDDLSPVISAVKMRINSFDLHDDDDILQLEKTNNTIDDVLKKMREISFDLMPGALLRIGIVPAISQFITLINQSGSLHIDFTAEDEIKLDEQKAINLYRIVKEITNNVVKHAKASILVLILRKEENKLIFEATDNGVGFNIHQRKEGIGFGLRSIVNRTELMGGETFLTSTIGKGTSYTIEIPL